MFSRIPRYLRFTQTTPLFRLPNDPTCRSTTRISISIPGRVRILYYSTAKTTSTSINRFTKSGKKMTLIARKVFITASEEGLLILPATTGKRTERSFGVGVKIGYGGAAISTPIDANEYSSRGEGTDFWGIAGILKVSPETAYVIAVTKREQVAVINKGPVYVVVDVAIIPLGSREDATTALKKSHDAQADKSKETDDFEEEEDDASIIMDDELQPEDDISMVPPSEDGTNSSAPKTTVSQDVIKNKGMYGRFAERWFSKRGWAVESKQSLGLSENAKVITPPMSPALTQKEVDEDVKKGSSAKGKPVDGERESALPAEASQDVDTEAPAKELAQAVAGKSKETVAHTLTPKLLHSVRLLMATSRSFFFSYDLDLTHSLNEEQSLWSTADVPLCKQVNPLYYWNKHLQKPLEDAGHTYFVLPLMQGFIRQATFNAKPTPPTSKSGTPETEEPEPNIEAAVDTIEEAQNSVTSQAEEPVKSDKSTQADDEKEFKLTVITRRSIKRAGLRYLRRGVDEEGYCANQVETEQILDTGSKVHSFVQIRGSIPLYFQQSPYNLKPKPVLLHSQATNEAAFRKHIKLVQEKYGQLFGVSLVEKHGNEAIIGNKYAEAVEKFNKDLAEDDKRRIGFEWFDFHQVCRGMKFENVAKLFDVVEKPLEEFGWTQMTKDKKVERRQQGVLRTNCMDCLDRTNVVQSACARRVLDMQLAQEGIDLSTASTDWFNLMWADNGDAVSKQYASTAALKGDYTRTRKRNYRGALTDFGLTMSRYFTNIISDFFTQAAIDFLLGNVTEKVFTEFEANMMSSDPAVSMKRVRQNAIEISQKIVIADDTEELIGGWTVLTPRVENHLRATPFTENVLLLTTAALYSCHFDFAMEKVSAFTRIDLRHILNIQYGAYITSTLTSSQTDEEHNVGFVVRYIPGATDVQRVNTRTLSSVTEQSIKKETKILAFKALPSSSAVISRGAVGEEDTHEVISEGEVVEGIVAEIQRACGKNEVRSEKEGPAREPVVDSFVVRKDVVSLAEAKKSAGFLESWTYNLKKLVWA